jgi:cysteine desulfurase / selenocysteine lyase
MAGMREGVRKDFPMLGGELVYLDTAATALKPQVVIDAVNRYYAEECGTVHRGVYQLAVKNTEKEAEVRRQVARFLGAPTAEEIVFTKGTTEAINLVAHCLGEAYVDMGDEVAITEIEHHANIVPWQLMCEARGASLKVLPVDDRGQLILEAFEKVLTHKTKVVSLGHVSNALGTVHPVKEAAILAKEVGAMVVVDGAQAAPHMRVDVQELGVDFYAFSAHKAYGPTGIGALFGRREILDTLPPYQGGGDMIENVTFEETTYAQVPLRFEAGTPHIAGIHGLGAALEYLEGVGFEAIGAHERELGAYATERLGEIAGLKIIGEAEEKAAIISFVVEGCHPLDIGTLLDLKGIAVRTGHHCAQPAMNRFGVTHTVRASFALYNTRQDVDRFVDALIKVIAKIK